MEKGGIMIFLIGTGILLALVLVGIYLLDECDSTFLSLLGIWLIIMSVISFICLICYLESLPS